MKVEFAAVVAAVASLAFAPGAVAQSMPTPQDLPQILGQVLAHDPTMPSCDRPVRPASFESQADADEFLRRAEDYLACMKAFFEEQTRVSQGAARAANAALEDMTSFAAEVNR